jgi:hypothetical protein
VPGVNRQMRRVRDPLGQSCERVWREVAIGAASDHQRARGEVAQVVPARGAGSLRALARPRRTVPGVIVPGVIRPGVIRPDGHLTDGFPRRDTATYPGTTISLYAATNGRLIGRAQPGPPRSLGTVPKDRR